VAGRTPERLEAVVEEIEASGGRATAVPCDATESAEVVALLDRAIEEGGRLDLVAYNVGNNQFSSLLDMTDEFFENLWRLCCFGGFIVGRESARRMLDQGSGTILFTGATASVRARPPIHRLCVSQVGPSIRRPGDGAGIRPPRTPRGPRHH
jgi:NAD(P)-dependent dehydrogenase (short-subunit alcohol dehydrogenase family)